MLFHTWPFLIFLLVVLPVFFALRRTRLWIPWLMVASYFFYGWWNPYYLLLVVYSTTLDAVTTPRTRLERTFDAAGVSDLVAASTSDVSIGGPGLAAHALRAGIVDQVSLFLVPVVVGGGTAALPDHVRIDLDLAEQRRFTSGVVYLRYLVVR